MLYSWSGRHDETKGMHLSRALSNCAAGARLVSGNLYCRGAAKVGSVWRSCLNFCRHSSDFCFWPKRL